jgi:hypothetical protein
MALLHCLPARKFHHHLTCKLEKTIMMNAGSSSEKFKKFDLIKEKTNQNDVKSE